VGREREMRGEGDKGRERRQQRFGGIFIAILMQILTVNANILVIVTLIGLKPLH
jgi:hypothetical protein